MVPAERRFNLVEVAGGGAPFQAIRFCAGNEKVLLRIDRRQFTVRRLGIAHHDPASTAAHDRRRRVRELIIETLTFADWALRQRWTLERHRQECTVELRVLARLVLGYVVALPLIVGLLAGAVSDSGTYTIAVTMESSVPGHVQVFFDSGVGFSEVASSNAWFETAPGAHEYRLRLPAGRYRRFRLDPGTLPGRYAIERVRILAPDGSIHAEIPLAALEPAYQITVVEKSERRLDRHDAAGHERSAVAVFTRRTCRHPQSSAHDSESADGSHGGPGVVRRGCAGVAWRPGDCSPGIGRRSHSDQIGIVLGGASDSRRCGCRRGGHDSVDVSGAARPQLRRANERLPAPLLRQRALHAGF